MNPVVIANFVSLIGCIMMVLTGFIKKKEHILLTQCFQFGFLGAGNLILGAYAGFVSGVISIIRNLAAARFPINTPMKLGFIAVQVLLSIGAVQKSPLEWLPIFSGFLFTWFIDAKSVTVLKIAIIAAQAMWLIYDFTYQNYVTMTCDLFTILSNLAGIWMVRKQVKA